MNENIAIKVSGVSKNFKLPHEKITSVKSLFVHPFRARRELKAETQHALKDISFEIKKGEFFGIVGRNGSGKSTLLKIIAGIYQPTKGKVHVNGRLVPFIELGVGFNPELTGRENVYLNGALMGFSTKEIDVMYDDIVDFAELKQFMDQKLKNYSSGMQVRLAFSVATRAKADILLIDEVLAVGDADFQRKCYQYFRSLKKQKKTVIFVSHDMEAVREYCDKCIVVDDSSLLYEGIPEVAAEKYIKLFNKHEGQIDNIEQEKNDVRWGDGSATTGTVEVVVRETSIVIGTTVVFEKLLEEPIVGFAIKNSSGDYLCGTNSKILGVKLGLQKKGSQMRLSWEVANIFGDDIYTVEIAVTHRDGVTQADWWHDAASFKIVNNTSTPHPVSPPIKLSVGS